MIEMKTLTMDGKTHEIVDAKARKDIRTTRAPSIVQTVEGNVVAMNDSSNDPLLGLKLLGKTTQNTTSEPTPDNPQELVSITPTVNAYGKNILDESQLVYHPEYTDVYSSALSVLEYHMKKGVTCTISFDTENTGVLMYLNPNSGFTYEQFIMDGKRHSFTATMKNDIDNSKSTLAMVSMGETSDVSCGLISNVQIEIGNVATDYEPYKPAQTISVNCSIPGIPVSQNGNYTDESGQQWICDEIDFGRGVHVHRVCEETIPFSAEEDTNGIRYRAFLTHKTDPIHNGFIMSDKFKYNAHANPGVNGIRISTYSTDLAIAYFNDMVIDSATVLYPLANPYETVLSDEELETFADFCTNYPSTTIYNSSDAWMEVSYNADTKNFIKNYIAEAMT